LGRKIILHKNYRANRHSHPDNQTHTRTHAHTRTALSGRQIARHL